MEQENNYSIETDHRALRVLWSAFVAGQLMFAAIVYVLTGSGHTFAFDPADPMSIVMLALTIGCVTASFIVFRQSLQKTAQLEGYAEKIAQYRAGYILRFALLEGVSLFAIIQVLLSHSFVYYGFFAISFTCFLLAAPALSTMSNNWVPTDT